MSEICGDVLPFDATAVSRSGDAVCELPADHREWHQMTDNPDLPPLRWIKSEDWDERPALSLVGGMKRCIVHDQSYTRVCSGCRADELATTKEVS